MSKTKAHFMSMRWLRLHIKEIIWATVILFVGSVFIIGYGTRQAAKQQEEREQSADDAERRADEISNAIPQNLRDKISSPVALVSLNIKNASATAMIDVKSLWQTLKNDRDYQRFFGGSINQSARKMLADMFKNKALDGLITENLIRLYAKIKNIRPPVTAEAIVASERQKISPREFNRKLQKQGLTVTEYGKKCLDSVIMQMVAAEAMQSVAPASATESFLKDYYETNRIRFKKDNKISFNHFLISPNDFAKDVSVSDERAKDYYDKHRSDFVSSRRLQLRHIFIDPQNEEYKKTVNILPSDIKREYTDNLKQYRKPEQVKARHILIKPFNTFEEQFDSFTANIRDFEAEQIDEKRFYSFSFAVSGIKSEALITDKDFAIETADGGRLKITPEALSKLENPLSLPITGSAKAYAAGRLGFFAQNDSEPVKLIITVKGSDKREINIASAFDKEKAFAAAEAKIKQIEAELKSGADFEKLAKEYSQDLGSASKGGDLGAFERGTMVKPFENAAFAAAPNTLTAPVKSNFGWHIIKVEEKIQSKITPFEEVQGSIEKSLRSSRATLKAEGELEAIRQKVMYSDASFEELAKMTSMAGSRKNGGRLPVVFKGAVTDDYDKQQQEIIKKELCCDNNTLNSDIENAVFNLNVGEVSEVIKTDDGFHIFKLEEILEPIQLSLTPALTARIKDIIAKEDQKRLAKEKADELRKNHASDNVEALAKRYFGDEKIPNIAFGPFTFSITNPGLANYELANAADVFSIDGLTYLPAIHAVLAKLAKSASYKGTVAGPIETELGCHFIELTNYESDSYEAFDEVKDSLKAMLTNEPSDKDIKEAFEAQKDSLDVPAKREIRQIVLQDESTANDLRKRLDNGEIFALLAKKYSIDGSSDNGGLISPVKRGHLSADLDKAVWQLKKGEITPVIKTPYGFVIAMLEKDEIPGKKASLNAETTNSIKRALQNELKSKQLDLFLKGLKNQACIIRYNNTLNEI